MKSINNFLQAIDQRNLAEKQLEQSVTEGISRYKEIESEISDCLHIIELLPMNGGKLSKVSSKLKDLLKERRSLKPITHYSGELKNYGISPKFDTISSILSYYNASSSKYYKEAEKAYTKLFKD